MSGDNVTDISTRNPDYQGFPPPPFPEELDSRVRADFHKYLGSKQIATLLKVAGIFSQYQYYEAMKNRPADFARVRRKRSETGLKWIYFVGDAYWFMFGEMHLLPPENFSPDSA